MRASQGFPLQPVLPTPLLSLGHVYASAAAAASGAGGSAACAPQPPQAPAPAGAGGSTSSGGSQPRHGRPKGWGGGRSSSNTASASSSFAFVFLPGGGMQVYKSSSITAGEVCATFPGSQLHLLLTPSNNNKVPSVNGSLPHNSPPGHDPSNNNPARNDPSHNSPSGHDRSHNSLSASASTCTNDAVASPMAVPVPARARLLGGSSYRVATKAELQSQALHQSPQPSTMPPDNHPPTSGTLPQANANHPSSSGTLPADMANNPIAECGSLHPPHGSIHRGSSGSHLGEGLPLPSYRGTQDVQHQMKPPPDWVLPSGILVPQEVQLSGSRAGTCTVGVPKVGIRTPNAMIISQLTDVTKRRARAQRRRISSAYGGPQLPPSFFHSAPISKVRVSSLSRVEEEDDEAGDEDKVVPLASSLSAIPMPPTGEGEAPNRSVHLGPGVRFIGSEEDVPWVSVTQSRGRGGANKLPGMASQDGTDLPKVSALETSGKNSPSNKCCPPAGLPTSPPNLPSGESSCRASFGGGRQVKASPSSQETKNPPCLAHNTEVSPEGAWGGNLPATFFFSAPVYPGQATNTVKDAHGNPPKGQRAGLPRPKMSALLESFSPSRLANIVSSTGLFYSLPLAPETDYALQKPRTEPSPSERERPKSSGGGGRRVYGGTGTGADLAGYSSTKKNAILQELEQWEGSNS